MPKAPVAEPNSLSERQCQNLLIAEIDDPTELPGSSFNYMAIELCCGSAGLSRALCDVGMHAIGIDHLHNKLKPKAPVFIADLSSNEGQLSAMSLVNRCKPYIIHSGPPCGTSSRARERPIPKHLKLKGVPEPRPLRTDQYPLGVPTLAGTDLLRVQSANSIYSFVLELFIDRHSKGLKFSLENPSTSIFWMIPAAVSLQNMPGVYVYDFQQCCHGGQRPVWRRWVTNVQQLESLVSRCPGESDVHKHVAFRIHKDSGRWRFDTADEAAYPRTLCLLYAEAVKKSHVEQLSPDIETPPDNTVDDEHRLSEEEHKLKKAKTRASVGIFVRGNRFPPLISEFSDRFWTEVSGEAGDIIDVANGRKARILKGNGVSTARHEPNAGNASTSSGEHLRCLGVFRTPQEFIEQAKKIRHPIDLPSFLPEGLLRNVFFLLTTPALDVSKDRLYKLQQIRKWSVELEEKNKEIFASMNPVQAAVSKGKHFALLDKILSHIGYPDTKVVTDIIKGTVFTGEIPESGVFPRRYKPADFTVEEVLRASPFSKKWVLDHTSSTGDAEIDQAVWEETLEEEKRGWLSGAMEVKDLQALVGDRFVVARRFGIRQGGKFRNIDDYSVSGANGTVTSVEKLDLLGTDELFAALKTIVQAVKDDGSVQVSLPSGDQLHGKIPPGMLPEIARTWKGKTFDLKSAYRQISVCQDSSNLPFAIVSVFNPVLKRPELRLQYATPFGSVSSVYLFNRIARAIWAIGVWLRIVWVNFFDDYPTVEPESSVASAELTVRAMCMILGWELQLDPAKNKSFAEAFNMLGIVTCLKDLPTGIARAANKEGRISDIVSIIDRILETGICPKPLIDELRGKCQFSMAQMSGRIAAGPVSGLSEHQYRSKTEKISEQTRLVLLRLKDAVSMAGPRELRCLGTELPICVFTDGACEPGAVTMGAVVIDVANSFPAFMWGCDVPKKLISRWRRDGIIQVIGQAELLPVVICKWAYTRLFQGRRVIYFIDNDSARFALTAGYSISCESNRLIQFANRCESGCQTWSWYTRVPSLSNPADDPSRLILVPSPSNLWANVVDPPEVPNELIDGP